MNLSRAGEAIEEGRFQAKRLVSQLDEEELFVLVELANGMSSKAIADRKNGMTDEVERTLDSLMNKLGVRTIADAVRLAILADL